MHELFIVRNLRLDEPRFLAHLFEVDILLLADQAGLMRRKLVEKTRVLKNRFNFFLPSHVAERFSDVLDVAY